MGRGRASSPLSAAAVLLPALPRGRVTRSRQNTMRVQPSLPSIFLHGFARQCRTCSAPPAAPARSSPRCSPSTTSAPCQPPRRRQTAQERHPHMHERGTELHLGVCALCFGLALDCASGFVVASATLSEHGTRYVLNTVAVSSLSSAALTRDRVASTSTRRPRSFPLLPPPVSPLDGPALAEPPPACACPKKPSRSPSFLKNVAQMFSDVLLEF